jgi:hypothetical protein
LPVTLRVASLPRGGTFYLLARADPADGVREANETDNLGVGPQVDLPGEAPDVALSLGTQPPATVRRGAAVGARVLLRNLGPGRHRGFATLELRDSQGQNVLAGPGGALRKVKLQPGGWKAVSLHLKVPRRLAPGDYLLSAFYAPSAGPSDVDRGNNGTSMTLHVD